MTVFIPLGQAADPIQFRYSFRGAPVFKHRPDLNAWRAYHFASFDQLPEEVLISPDRAQRAVLMGATELKLTVQGKQYRFDIWQGVETERDGQRHLHWFDSGEDYSHADVMLILNGEQPSVIVSGVWDLPVPAGALNA